MLRGSEGQVLFLSVIFTLRGGEGQVLSLSVKFTLIGSEGLVSQNNVSFTLNDNKIGGGGGFLSSIIAILTGCDGLALSL